MPDSLVKPLVILGLTFTIVTAVLALLGMDATFLFDLAGNIIVSMLGHVWDWLSGVVGGTFGSIWDFIWGIFT